MAEKLRSSTLLKTMVIFGPFVKLTWNFFLLLDDAQTQNGTLLFTDDATIQCVAVSVSSVSAGSTDESCLSLTLSAATTVTGLTLSPSLADICVQSADGKSK